MAAGEQAATSRRSVPAPSPGVGGGGSLAVFRLGHALLDVQTYLTDREVSRGSRLVVSAYAGHAGWGL